jgi:DNA relaxase NicK
MSVSKSKKDGSGSVAPPEAPTLSNRSGLTTVGLIDYLTVTHLDLNIYELKKAFFDVAEKTPLFALEAPDEDELEVSHLYSKDYHTVKRWFHGAYVGKGLKRFGVRFDGDPSKAGVVNLGGSALKIMRDAGYSDKMIVMWFVNNGFKFTRLDFAIDFEDKSIWNSLRKYLKNGYYASNVPSKNMTWIENRDEAEGDTEPKTRTFYIGSQKNGSTVICAYDKKYQVKQVYKHTVKKESWYRFEVRFKREMAQRLALTISVSDWDIPKVCRGRVAEFIDFKMMSEFKSGTKIKNKQRMKTARWWKDFIGFGKVGLEPIGENLDDYDIYKKEQAKMLSSQLMTRFLMEEDEEILDEIRGERIYDNTLRNVVLNRTDDIVDVLKVCLPKYDDKKTSRLERLIKDRKAKSEKKSESSIEEIS